jgi:hypothetical protein
MPPGTPAIQQHARFIIKRRDRLERHLAQHLESDAADIAHALTPTPLVQHGV